MTDKRNKFKKKKKMQELWFLHSARRLLLIDIHMKFRVDSLEQFSRNRADTI